MLLSHDVAVNTRPRRTNASYSSTYSRTPGSFHIDTSCASTASRAPQPCSSTAGLALNPVQFSTPEM